MLANLLNNRMDSLESEDLAQLISSVLIMRSGRLREAAAHINELFRSLQGLQRNAVPSTSSQSYEAMIRVLYYLLNACKLFQAKRLLQKADKYLIEGNLLRATEYYNRVKSLTNEGATFVQATHNLAVCLLLQKSHLSNHSQAVDSLYRCFSSVFPIPNKFNSFSKQSKQLSVLELAAVTSGLHYVACTFTGKIQQFIRSQCDCTSSSTSLTGMTLVQQTKNRETKQILKFCRSQIQRFGRDYRTADNPHVLAIYRLQEVCDLLLLLSDFRLVEAETLLSRIASSLQISIDSSPQQSQQDQQQSVTLNSHRLLKLLQQSSDVLQKMRQLFLQSVTVLMKSQPTIRTASTSKKNVTSPDEEEERCRLKKDFLLDMQPTSHSFCEPGERMRIPRKVDNHSVSQFLPHPASKPRRHALHSNIPCDFSELSIPYHLPSTGSSNSCSFLISSESSPMSRAFHLSSAHSTVSDRVNFAGSDFHSSSAHSCGPSIVQDTVAQEKSVTKYSLPLSLPLPNDSSSSVGAPVLMQSISPPVPHGRSHFPILYSSMNCITPIPSASHEIDAPRSLDSLRLHLTSASSFPMREDAIASPVTEPHDTTSEQGEVGRQTQSAESAMRMLPVNDQLHWSDVLQCRATLRPVHQETHSMLQAREDDDPSVTQMSSVSNTFVTESNQHYPVPLERLLAPGPYPTHVPPHCREAFLSDQDFVHALGVSKEQFYMLPRWKQSELKRGAGLF